MMTNFEQINKLIEAGIDFILTITDQRFGDTRTFYCPKDKLYPEYDEKYPCFWYDNEYGLECLFYPNDYDITITKEVK